MPVRAHLDGERGRCRRGADPLEPAPLGGEDVAEDRPSGAPGVLLDLLGIERRQRVVERERLESRRREEHPEGAVPIALDDVAPRAAELHPRGLGPPGLPEPAELDPRRVVRCCGRVERIGEDEGVRLDDRIEEAVVESVRRPVAVRGTRPPPEPREDRSHRLAGMRDAPRIDQGPVLDAKPGGAGRLRRLLRGGESDEGEEKREAPEHGP